MFLLTGGLHLDLCVCQCASENPDSTTKLMPIRQAPSMGTCMQLHWGKMLRTILKRDAVFWSINGVNNFLTVLKMHPSKNEPATGLICHLPDANTKQPLSAPALTGHKFHLTHSLGLTAVHQQLDWLLHIGFEQVLQHLIVLILQSPCILKYDRVSKYAS